MKTNGVRRTRSLPSTTQPNPHERIAPQHRQRGPDERRPFAAAEPLLLALAVAHDVGVEAETRVVDEGAAVDLGDVDLHPVAVDDRPDRFFEVGRHAGVAREVVQRAEGEHAERHRLVGERTGDRADRAVAAAGDDHVGLARERGLDRGADLGAAARQADVGIGAGRVEQRAQPFEQRVVVAETGAGIDDDADLARHRSAAIRPRARRAVGRCRARTRAARSGRGRARRRLRRTPRRRR